MIARCYSVIAVPGVPLVRQGDDLCRTILDACAAADLALCDGDVVVLAQKIVSKAEGRQVALDTVEPSPTALALAETAGKDPRLVELILAETDEVMRVRPGVIIVRHRLGLVLANAGIDQSNVMASDSPQALLLPVDPDASAVHLRGALSAETGAAVAVLIIDSLGRAWRLGTIGTAIGVAGLSAIVDLRGRTDLNGRKLESSELGLADEIAAAASLAMGQTDEGTPVAIVRGLRLDAADGLARDLIRARALDLFP